MLKYTNIAKKFHSRFEGADLYPNLKSWIWVAWVAYALDFIAATGVFLYVVGTTTSHSWSFFFGALVISAEIGFLVTSNAIDDHKNKKQNQRFKLKGTDVTEQLHDAKRKELEDLLGQRASNFLAVAQEVAELQATKKLFAQPDLGFWSSIFHPDSKSRLIAILLGAIGLIGALIANSVGSTALFDLIASGHLPFLLVLCAFIAAVFHFFIYLCRLAYRVLSGKVMEWLLRLGWSKAAEKLALNYMVNALVDLHEPVKTEPRRLRAAAVRQRLNALNK